MAAPSRFVYRPLSALASLALPVLIAAGLAAAGLMSGSSYAAAQGTHLWSQSQMEQYEKGTPDGVAIESDGQLRQGPGLTEQLTTPSTFVWALVADKAGQVYAGTGTPASVLRLPAQKGEKPFTLFETRDLSVQALCLGPNGTLYAATLPSGKVYKLNTNAKDKQDETSATVVFDAAKVGSAAGGESKPVAATERPIPLHLGTDVGRRRTAVYRNRQSRRDLSRRSREARRGAGIVLQERRGAYPRSCVGRKGESDCWLRWFRAGLPHRPAGQGIRALRGATARDYLPCDRGERHYLCGVRRRQEPQLVASVAGAGNQLGQCHDRAAGVVAGGKYQRLCARGIGYLRLDRGPGATQALGGQGRDCLCAGCSGRRSVGAERESRTRLSHS